MLRVVDPIRLSDRANSFLLKMEATQKNWADDFISNSTNLISYPLPRVPGNFVTDNLSNQLSFPRYEIFKVSVCQQYSRYDS